VLELDLAADLDDDDDDGVADGSSPRLSGAARADLVSLPGDVRGPWRVAASVGARVVVDGAPVAGGATGPAGRPVSVQGLAPGRWTGDVGPARLVARVLAATPVDGAGRLTWGDVVSPPEAPAGEVRAVTLLDAGARPVGRANGRWYPFGNIPGGLMLVPEPEARGASGRVEL
jgi:hypothetical protein